MSRSRVVMVFPALMFCGCVSEYPSAVALRKWSDVEAVSDWSVMSEYVEEPSDRSQEVPPEHRGEAVASLEDTAFRRLLPVEVAHFGGRRLDRGGYLLRAFAFTDRPYVIHVSRRGSVVHTDSVASASAHDPKLRRTAVIYYDPRPIDHVYVGWGIPTPLDTKRPNQALEPTPDGRGNSLSMTSSPHSVATLALVRRASAWSR